MQIKSVSKEVLKQLLNLTRELQDEDYRKPVEVLSHATIGQHLRHTLEFFVCLKHGKDSGLINYDQRARDLRIEQDRCFAMEVIHDIMAWIEDLRQQEVRLVVDYGIDAESSQEIASNIERELCYNIEHAVHHMALIKIGVRAIAKYLVLPEDFGVAASTIRHMKSQGLEA